MMVMLVMFLLGAALLQYSTTDLLHVDMDKKRMQAYYIARSGASAALTAWQEAPANQKPSGTEENRAYGNGHFTVTITNHSDHTEIVSIGVVDGVSQEARIIVDLSGGSGGSGSGGTGEVYGHELFDQWYNFTNGHFVDKVHDPVDGVIKLKAKNKLKHSANQNYTSFESDWMIFESILGDPMKSRLDLTAEIIIFNKLVDINTKGIQKGSIVMFVPEGSGITIDENIYGRVYFNNVTVNNSSLGISYKGYYFLKEVGGVDITNVVHRYPPYMIEIESGDPNYEVPVPAYGDDEGDTAITWG